MHRFFGSLLLVVATLAGCATAPEVRRTERSERILLTESASVVTYGGLNVRNEWGALPGAYAAEKEDEDGVYFFGEGRSIWTTNDMIQKKPRVFVGGIYLPGDPARPPRFFYVFEAEKHTVENIDRLVQDRIVMAESMPATSGGIGLGPSVAGNVLGGAIVNALIQADVGKLVKLPAIEDVHLRKRILAARQAL